MRKSLDFDRFSGHQPKRWSVCIALALAIPLLATGCSKKSDTSTSNLASPSASDSTATAAATPAPAGSSQPASAASATNAMPNLQALNQALLGWRMQNQRVPASFAEFAASANINIPPPPPGKKYVINSHGLISLVNAN
jgi:hypothetical protein